MIIWSVIKGFGISSGITFGMAHFMRNLLEKVPAPVGFLLLIVVSLPVGLIAIYGLDTLADLVVCQWSIAKKQKESVK